MTKHKSHAHAKGSDNHSVADKDPLKGLETAHNDLPHGTYAEVAKPTPAQGDKLRLGEGIGGNHDKPSADAHKSSADTHKPSADTHKTSNKSGNKGGAHDKHDGAIAHGTEYSVVHKDPLANLKAPTPPSGAYANQTAPHEADEDAKRLGEDVLERPTSEAVVDTMSVGNALGMERDASARPSLDTTRNRGGQNDGQKGGQKPASGDKVNAQMERLAMQDNTPGGASREGRAPVSSQQQEQQEQGQIKEHPADVKADMGNRHDDGVLVAEGGPKTEEAKEKAHEIKEDVKQGAHNLVEQTEELLSGGLATHPGEGRPTLDEMVARGEELMQG